MISGPLTRKDRIASIDVLRGLALFGIVIVNAAYFGLPLAEVMNGPESTDPPADRITWVLVKTFAEFKFISIFSLLFGFGIAMQRSRRLASGRSFAGFGIRRMLILGLFGLTHALGLWFGDILFMYALVGLLLIPILLIDPGPRLAIALLGIGWSMLVTIGFALLGTWTMTAPDPETLDLSHRGFQAMMKAGLDPMHPNWIAGEIAAFGDGPFLDAMAYRGMTFVSYVVISVFSVYWHIIGMAIIGSWLHDRDFFTSAGSRLQKLFITTLLPVGLVLSIACGISFWYREDHPVVASIMTGIQMVSASMIALGIVGLVTILVDRGRMPLASLFASVGRMSLTAYLLESVIFIALMSHWGLSWFNEGSLSQLVGIAALVYVGVTIFCLAWSSLFRMGPVEWIWRQGSYLGLAGGDFKPRKPA
ncbi:MAG: hypothetical protein CMJ34_10065 [Phycisphaerae bacterium]|nr:hypothetical protein [Phycisphaerae bacterium]